MREKGASSERLGTDVALGADTFLPLYLLIHYTSSTNGLGKLFFPSVVKKKKIVPTGPRCHSRQVLGKTERHVFLAVLLTVATIHGHTSTYICSLDFFGLPL